MLKGKNIVIVKGDKNTPTLIQEYDRVYLEFGEKDTLEKFSKTSEGKDVQLNGAKWEGLRPAESVTKTDVANLMTEALAHFSEKYPKTNSYVSLLKAASYGDDLATRNAIQANIRPGKPVDKGASIVKMAKMLMAMNPKLTLAKATLIATAATEQDGEEDQAA
jgi:hypothetical protein